MPTDLPERKEEKPSVAYMVGAAIAGYMFAVLTFLTFNAALALLVMGSLDIMHSYEPQVPPLGFGFLHAALVGTSALALAAGFMVRLVLRDDE